MRMGVYQYFISTKYIPSMLKKTHNFEKRNRLNGKKTELNEGICELLPPKIELLIFLLTYDFNNNILVNNTA